MHKITCTIHLYLIFSMMVLFISGSKQLSLLRALIYTVRPHLFVHSEVEVLHALILEGSAQHSLQVPFLQSGRFTALSCV